ncbi:MAG: hypothetical protein RSD27_11670 [Ruthenibacterium sp.]
MKKTVSTVLALVLAASLLLEGCGQSGTASAAAFDTGLKVTLQDLGWTQPNLYLARRDDLYSVAYWYQTLPAPVFPMLPDRQRIRFISEG